MNKQDVQELYKQVKRRRNTKKKADLFQNKPKSGCKSCGRVTWKPGQ